MHFKAIHSTSAQNKSHFRMTIGLLNHFGVSPAPRMRTTNHFDFVWSYEYINKNPVRQVPFGGKIRLTLLAKDASRLYNQNLKYVSGGTPKTWDSFAAIFLDTGRRSCSIADRFCIEMPSFCARTF